MSGYDVYGIGHALVDAEVEVDDAFLQTMDLEKGTMSLVDEARQAALLAALDGAQIKQSCGGSAANTVIGTAQLGGKTCHAFKVADDQTGAFFIRDMRANGVDSEAVQPEAGTTGRCLVLITPDAERTMCTHLGISERLSPRELSEARLKSAAYLYVEGYLVSNPVTLGAAQEAIALARRHGVKVALTFSDISMIRFFRDGMDALVGDGVDLIFCNENEALEFTGAETVEAAQRLLMEKAKGVVATLGARGALVDDGSGPQTVPGQAVKPVDTNGAGDLFAGAFLYGVNHGMGFDLASRLACKASSVLVTRFGARLKVGETREVLRAFSRQ